MTKLEKIRREIEKEYPMVFPKKRLLSQLLKMHEEKLIGESIRNTIKSQCKKVPIEWNRSAEYNFVSFFPDKVELEDVIHALQNRYYFTHHSAMYFNGLTDQRPNNYYLSKEVNPKRQDSGSIISPESIQQAYRKDYRFTSKYFDYKSNRFYLIEKESIARLGVKNRQQYAGTGREELIWFTDPERTLLDSIMSPQYSGGMDNVLSVYSKSKLNLDKLKEYYRAINPNYPFWQLIGFILNITEGRESASRWSSFFMQDKIDFYFDKNYRSDWNYSKNWAIFYPGWVDYVEN